MKYGEKCMHMMMYNLNINSINNANTDDVLEKDKTKILLCWIRKSKKMFFVSEDECVLYYLEIYCYFKRNLNFQCLFLKCFFKSFSRQ